MNADLGRRLLAEFVGTALLVIFGVSVLQPTRTPRLEPGEQPWLRRIDVLARRRQERNLDRPCLPRATEPKLELPPVVHQQGVRKALTWTTRSTSAWAPGTAR